MTFILADVVDFFLLTPTQIIAWIAYTVLTLSPASAIFTVVAAAYMFPWATTRHRVRWLIPFSFSHFCHIRSWN